MARAKNTDRAEARRRYRAARAAQLGIPESALDEGDEESKTLVTSGGGGADATSGTVAPVRRSFLRVPNVRADLRALPGMLRTRKRLWIPFVMLLVGFVAEVASNRGLLGPPEAPLAAGARLYSQLILYPTGFLVFFIGGFLAPRAAYLVGMLLGIVDGTLLSIAFLLNPAFTATAAGAGTTPIDPVAAFVYLYGYAIVIGTLAGAFGAFYRDFLRQSQERSRAARAARDAKVAAQRREAKRQSRQAPVRGK